MTIHQIVRDPELLKSYREWMQHPVTKMMHELTVKFSRPIGLPNVTGEHALYAQGHAVASANFLRIMFDLEDVVEEQRQLAKMKVDPDYGLRSILEEDGYPSPTKRRAKKTEETQ